MLKVTTSPGRILRLLAAVNFVDESGEEKWRGNETTKVMASDPIAAGHRFV